MSVIEPRPGIGASNATDDVAPGARVVDGRYSPQAVHGGIESLLRLKESLPLLAPDRERDFALAIDEAWLAAARGIEGEIAAALIALDFLSLELCDE